MPPTTSTPEATVSSATASFPTPKATVIAFYNALSRHDRAGALAVLTPQLAAEYAAAGSDGDLTNIIRLDHLRDVHSAPGVGGSDFPPGYVDITQVVATYDVVYRHVVAAASGTQIRFVYVGRLGAQGPWRILEIGTGP